MKTTLYTVKPLRNQWYYGRYMQLFRTIEEAKELARKWKEKDTENSFIVCKLVETEM